MLGGRKRPATIGACRSYEQPRWSVKRSGNALRQLQPLVQLRARVLAPARVLVLVLVRVLAGMMTMTLCTTAPTKSWRTRVTTGSTPVATSTRTDECLSNLRTW